MQSQKHGPWQPKPDTWDRSKVFCKKNTLLAQKNCSTQILLFDPKSPTLVTKLPKLGVRYTILDILMHVNSYITFVNLCDLCDMFKDRLQYTLQYNIMINDSNHKFFFFSQMLRTFWPWYDAPKSSQPILGHIYLILR